MNAHAWASFLFPNLQLMRLLITSSLLLTAPLFAQQLPEVEPNDSSAAAQAILLGRQCNATLTAGENDWFSFTTPGGYHTITGSSGTDTRFYLWDATATTMVAFNDDSRSLTSDISRNLAAGTYLLQVTGWSATSAGAYSLDISAASPAKAFTGAEVEPNDNIAAANGIVDGAQIQGTIGLPTTVLSDVAAAGSTTTVINATTALVPGAHVGQSLRMTSGAAAGRWATITANTATALTIGSLAIAPGAGDTFDIEIGDVDVYQLVLTAPRSMVAFQISEGDAISAFTHRYEIWDAAGALLAPTTTYGAVAGDSGIYSGRTLQQVRCYPAGTYHIVVRHRSAWANVGGGPIVAPYPVFGGSYRLEVKARAMNVSGTVPENAEPNDTIATATPIVSGQQGLGNLTINTGSDVADLWGPINITQPSLLMFQTGNGALAPMLDTTIVLREYNPITGVLAAGTSATSGNTLEPTGTSHARSTVQFLLPGSIYYLEVRSPGTTAAMAGDYVLEISQIDALAYALGNVANFTANATGCGTAGAPAITRAFPSATTGELPTIGQPFVVQATNLNGVGNLGLMVTGFAQLPLPIDLTALGAPGCAVHVSPDFVELMVASPAGIADYVLTIPGNPALRGMAIYQQPCKWDAVTPVNALGIQPGGWARYILGDRAF